MAMKRFSKAKLPKMGKRPMMMAITALVIVFLFWFFFMRGGRSEGFREGAKPKCNPIKAGSNITYDKNGCAVAA
jgi:hypothetical protein